MIVFFYSFKQNLFFFLFSKQMFLFSESTNQKQTASEDIK